MHPLEGTWIANLAKSRRHANHQFHSASMRFDVSGTAVVLTHGGVNMSGKPESATTTLQVDGAEYPIPQAPGMVSVCQWVGSRALETLGKKDGAVIGRATYTVSEEGDSMTAAVQGVDAQGVSFEQVIVFDRAS